MLNACKQWRNSNLKNNSRNVEVIPDFCPRPKIVRETARLSNLYIYDRHHSLNGSTRVLVAGKAKPIFNGLVRQLPADKDPDNRKLRPRGRLPS
jgi:hypothetical protein